MILKLQQKYGKQSSFSGSISSPPKPKAAAGLKSFPICPKSALSQDIKVKIHILPPGGVWFTGGEGLVVRTAAVTQIKATQELKRKKIKNKTQNNTHTRKTTPEKTTAERTLRHLLE